MNITKFGHIRSLEPTYSYGIACINKRRQICMVKRRLSYAFETFMALSSTKYINVDLFNGMTVTEKLLIKTLNFNILESYYNIMNNTVRLSGFATRESKFNKMFLYDNGVRIIEMLNKSNKCISGIWEIPKGRKLDLRETDLNVAIREFTEETGINEKDLIVHPDRQFTYSFTDCDRTYKYVYYLAQYIGAEPMNSSNMVKIINTNQVREIAEVGWLSKDVMRLFIDDSISAMSVLTNFAIDIINKGSKIIKNNKGCGYYKPREKYQPARMISDNSNANTSLLSLVP